MDQKALFRKAAIDKLASPEQLDVLMKVTSPKGWLALGTVALLLLGLVVWSFIGKIPTRVAGEGILLAGNFFSVDADGTGPLVEIYVREHDLVEANQLVAVVLLEDLSAEIRDASDTYENRRTLYENIRVGHQRSLREWDDRINRRENDLAGLHPQLAAVEERIANNDPNVPRNLLIQQRTDLEGRIGRLQDEIDQVSSTKRQSEQQLLQYQADMEDVYNRYVRLRDTGDRSAEVRTEVAGKVLDVAKRRNDTVRAGEVILRVLEDHGRGMEALFYVDSADAARIEVGDEVEVQSSAIAKEIYGFLKGRVIERSDDAISQAQLLREIGSDARAAKILQSGPNKRRVRAELIPADTPTGYLWSSGRGYEQQLDVIADVHDITVNVIVDEKRPIDLVIPRITSLLGLR